MLVLRKTYAFIVALCVTSSLAVAAAAQEQPACGDDIKAYVVEALSKYDKLDSPDALAIQKELYEKFKYCAADGEKLAAVLPSYRNQFCGKLSYLGSVYYEQMRCCGYDPQKRLFGCPIDVKQPVGFGPAPFPGSVENVLTCVNFGAGYVPVALDDVHLADAVSGSPVWEFAVIARAREQLAAQPLLGQTLPARSILSWQLIPTSCNYTPIWGNVIDYQIRLDP